MGRNGCLRHESFDGVSEQCPQSTAFYTPAADRLAGCLVHTVDTFGDREGTVISTISSALLFPFIPI